MFRPPLRMLIAVAAIIAGGTVCAQDAKSDQEHILGTWLVQSAKEEGKDVPDLQKAQFTFAKEGKLTLKLANATEPVELRYNLVTDKGKGIEISPPPLNDKDKGTNRNAERDRGIYKLEGDTLTISICDGPGPDSPAPKDFTVHARFVTQVVLKKQAK